MNNHEFAFNFYKEAKKEILADETGEFITKYFHKNLNIAYSYIEDLLIVNSEVREKVTNFFLNLSKDPKLKIRIKPNGGVSRHGRPLYYQKIYIENLKKYPQGFFTEYPEKDSKSYEISGSILRILLNNTDRLILVTGRKKKPNIKDYPLISRKNKVVCLLENPLSCKIKHDKDDKWAFTYEKPLKTKPRIILEDVKNLCIYK